MRDTARPHTSNARNGMKSSPCAARTATRAALSASRRCVAVDADVVRALCSRVCVRARSLGMLALSFSRSLLCWPAASCCSFLFRIRKIITKLIINCRAMQFERIMLHSLQYSRSLSLSRSRSLSLSAILATATSATC